MSKASAWRMLGALWLAEITAAYGASMIYAANKALIAQFGNPIMIGWLVAIFLLVGSAAAAVGSRLGDLYGRRRVLLALLIMAGVGLVLGTISSSYPLLLVARGLQGLTLAVLPLCLGILRERLPPERLPFGIGVVISGASAGSVVALVAGGILTDSFGWRGVFGGGAILEGLASAAVAAAVPASAPHRNAGAVDYVSAVMAIPAIAGLLFVISNGRTWGWSDPLLLGLLLSSLALDAIWIIRSLRLRDPLIDFRLFARRDVLVMNVTYMLIALGSFQITLIFSVLLQAPAWTGVGLGVAATTAGLAIMPSTLLALLIAPFTGLLVGRYGGRAVTIGGGIITITGWICGIAWHDSVLSVALGMCVMAAGGVILYAAGPAVLMNAVPPERTSEATGMMVVLRNIAMAAGAQIVAVLLATETVSDPAKGRGSFPSGHAFVLAMAVVTLISLAATLTATALRRSHRDPPASSLAVTV
ncbi:MAG: MFS transporter [Sphingomonadaceae bacterium]|nr:MFS transporter [Sphingomonadaceae bacterium]